jgi:response regulator RpfG family c-di-GMP phosphodiesterase
MRRARGKQFDPQLLDLFLERLDEVLAIRERLIHDSALPGFLWRPEDAA